MTGDAVGGVWTYAVDLARAMHDRNIKVMLAIMGPLPSIEQTASVTNVEIRSADFKLEWMSEPWEDVDRASGWLLSLEREFSPDIIHLNGYSHAALNWIAPKVVVAHSCVLSWWEAVRREPAPPEWNEYRTRISRGIQAADLVVVPTRAMLSEIERHYGELRRTSVIPNGRDSSLFQGAAKEPFVLTAGRFWDEGKNIRTLDRAAAGLKWPVYAAGESAPLECIHTLGFLPTSDLRAWFSKASIYALPAKYEPFGLSILEAALSGCALVLGDIPSLRENWNGAAMFVEPDNPDALRNRLKELIRSETLRFRFQRLARARAAKFSLDRTVDAYLKCYAALVAHNQPATVLSR